MIGRDLDTSYGRSLQRAPGELALEVKDLASARGVSGVNIAVRTGEIVGLAGLVGSGRSEVVRAIFGADRVTAGEVRVFGKLHRGGPHHSVGEGMALVPENRKQEGLALIRSVQDNLVLAALRKLFPSGWFKPALAGRAALELIAKLRIATPSPLRLVKYLSGGNQQKVVVGKWLGAGSRCFIFDEPTRGIDVGAKAEIFGLIEQLVAQGAAVLMVSSEIIEIVKVCDRAYVMREGRVVGELGRQTLTEENILRLAMHHG
jgi:ribose transport system ATP-binding protein